jgi:hypothetical protein
MWLDYYQLNVTIPMKDRQKSICIYMEKKGALAKSAAPGGRLAHLPSYQVARSMRPWLTSTDA